MLQRISVFQKVLLIVGVLGAGFVGIVVVAVLAFSALTRDMENAVGKGQLALLAARMNTNVQAMNAIQTSLALSPSADVLAEAKKSFTAEVSLFTQRLASARAQGDDPKLTQLLADLETKEQTFQTSAEAVFSLASSATGTSSLELVTASEAAAKNAALLREAARAVFAASDTTLRLVTDHAEHIAKQRLIVLIVLSVSALVLGGTFSYIVASRGLKHPLSICLTAIQDLSDGKLNISIKGTERQDELGDVARALGVFRSKLQQQKTMEEEQVRKHEEEQHKAREMLQLISTFRKGTETQLQEISAASRQLNSTSSRMANDASETDERATTVANAASEAASSVETVAAATEELAAAIQEISRQVTFSKDASQKASGAADRASQSVHSLAEMTSQITDIVNLITDIASQTNLLALNATIEAARAGEAGKGFAVVANEVKVLANQTARATDDISRQINAVQSQTKDVVDALKDVVETIRVLENTTTGIASAVEEQSAATQEIARNIEQAALGTTRVSENIASVQTAAGRNGEGAAEVHKSATHMSDVSSGLQSSVETFLTAVQRV